MKIDSTLSSNFPAPESSSTLLKNQFAMICRCLMFFCLTFGFASGLKAQNLSEIISNLKSELSKNPDDKKRGPFTPISLGITPVFRWILRLVTAKKPFRQRKNCKILFCWRRFTVIWERFILGIMISKIRKKII